MSGQPAVSTPLRTILAADKPIIKPTNGRVRLVCIGIPPPGIHRRAMRIPRGLDRRRNYNFIPDLNRPMEIPRANRRFPPPIGHRVFNSPNHRVDPLSSFDA